MYKIFDLDFLPFSKCYVYVFTISYRKLRTIVSVHVVSVVFLKTIRLMSTLILSKAYASFSLAACRIQEWMALNNLRPIYWLVAVHFVRVSTIQL